MLHEEGVRVPGRAGGGRIPGRPGGGPAVRRRHGRSGGPGAGIPQQYNAAPAAIAVPVRYIHGRDLATHPQNWRTYPACQLDGLRGILADVGIADAVKGFELPDGRVMLIDGHARAEVLPDQEIPVLVLDVTEAEAKKLLAAFDPVGDLAGADAGKLDALLKEVTTENAGLAALLDGLAHQHGLASGGEEGGESGDGGGGEQEVKEQFQVLVILKHEREQADLLERLAGEGYEVRSLVS